MRAAPIILQVTRISETVSRMNFISLMNLEISITCRFLLVILFEFLHTLQGITDRQELEMP